VAAGRRRSPSRPVAVAAPLEDPAHHPLPFGLRQAAALHRDHQTETVSVAIVRETEHGHLATTIDHSRLLRTEE